MTTDESKNPVGLEERRKCAGYITECIRNMSLHLNEKSKRCRYSPHIINVSMAMYLRSKKTYDDVRESGLMQLPHPRTLVKLISPMKVKPGLDPNIYFSIKNLLKRTKTPVCGHLMMDEIKLKNGIVWNCMNNEVRGFVQEELNTNTMLENILGLNSGGKKKPEKQLSVYSNQWRFRSTMG